MNRSTAANIARQARSTAAARRRISKEDRSAPSKDQEWAHNDSGHAGPVIECPICWPPSKEV